MRFVLKLLALLILGPVALLLLLVLAVIAIVGVPLLWDELTGRYKRPDEGTQTV